MAETQLARKYFDQLKEANERNFDLELAVAERDRKLDATSGAATRPPEGDANLREELIAAKATEESLRRTIRDLTKERNNGRSKILRLEKEVTNLKAAEAERRIRDLDTSSLRRAVVESDDEEPITWRTKRPRKNHAESDAAYTDNATDDAEDCDSAPSGTINFKIRGDGLDVAEGEEDSLTPELKRRVATTLNLWRNTRHGEYWVELAPKPSGRVGHPRSVKCVTRKLQAMGTQWGHGSGKYACNACVRTGRLCFRWDDEHSMALLPLHPSDRAGGGQEGEVGTWIAQG